MLEETPREVIALRARASLASSEVFAQAVVQASPESSSKGSSTKKRGESMVARSRAELLADNLPSQAPRPSSEGHRRPIRSPSRLPSSRTAIRTTPSSPALLLVLPKPPPVKVRSVRCSFFSCFADFSLLQLLAPRPSRSSAPPRLFRPSSRRLPLPLPAANVARPSPTWTSLSSPSRTSSQDATNEPPSDRCRMPRCRRRTARRRSASGRALVRSQVSCLLF